MTRITLDLIRRKAEHNDGDIVSLEELSLHQLDIEKIEGLDYYCRELKILYLQGNLISKIENLGRLKKLVYLNLALNNTEEIENLESCESLQKLDLTLNSIWKLTSIENLAKNIHLKELYLTGNQCVNYSNYRQFVVGKLANLKILDGVEISRTERIAARQNLAEIEKKITEEEIKFKDSGDTYTEQRRLAHDTVRKTRLEQKVQKPDKNLEKKKRITQAKDGRLLNLNEAKINFKLEEEEDCITLTVDTYKYMDTSLIDVDVHPTHVKVTVKGKLLQLVLPEEVESSRSVAKRSQVTGRLVISMPKVKPSKVLSADPRKIEDEMPRLEALDF